MSRESVVEFVKKAAADAALLGELEAAQSRAAVDVAARHGLRFTADEYAQVTASLRAGDATAELADDQLAKVAGGVRPIRRKR